MALNGGFTAVLIVLCMLVLSAFGWRKELFGELADIAPERGRLAAWTSMLATGIVQSVWLMLAHYAQALELNPPLAIPYAREWGVAVIAACSLRAPIRQLVSLCLGWLMGQGVIRMLDVEASNGIGAAELLDSLWLSFLLARVLSLASIGVAACWRRVTARNK